MCVDEASVLCVQAAAYPSGRVDVALQDYYLAVLPAAADAWQNQMK